MTPGGMQDFLENKNQRKSKWLHGRHMIPLHYFLAILFIHVMFYKQLLIMILCHIFFFLYFYHGLKSKEINNHQHMFEKNMIIKSPWKIISCIPTDHFSCFLYMFNCRILHRAGMSALFFFFCSTWRHEHGITVKLLLVASQNIYRSHASIYSFNQEVIPPSTSKLSTYMIMSAPTIMQGSSHIPCYAINPTVSFS